ncbi:MAG: S8 family serine peptidase [Caldilineaceae bacterium]
MDNPRIYQTHARQPALLTGWQPRLGLAPCSPTCSLRPRQHQGRGRVGHGLHRPGRGGGQPGHGRGVDPSGAATCAYRGWDARTDAADHVYNWFDAWETDGRPPRCADDAQVPCDDDGHGTHTVGTMLGNATASHDQVGMAPSATWIGCRNMVQGFGTPAAYAACFEFFLAPYPQDGDPFTQGRPELAPHIINNSWGCPPNEGCDPDTLQTVVENVRTAGIFVVSSAGNNGFLGCNTVVDPIAIYDAPLSVGAHAASGDIASFSSRGPVTVDASDRVKPDLTAGCGRGIDHGERQPRCCKARAWPRPTWPARWRCSGSAVSNLIRDIDTSEQIILKSATPVPVSLRTSDDPVSPNNVPTRLDALAAVTMARHPMHLTLTLTRWRHHADPGRGDSDAGGPTDRLLRKRRRRRDRRRARPVLLSMCTPGVRRGSQMAPPT